MRCIEVKGLLSYFFPRDIDITEDIVKSLIGLPIKNCNGIIIGQIDSVRWETGEWFGRIVTDDSITQHILDNYGVRRKITIEKEKEDGNL